VSLRSTLGAKIRNLDFERAAGCVGSQEYLKDLESGLIRVAKLERNKRGGSGKNKNLRKKLRNEIIQSIRPDFNAE
jgi:hypothetical protein